VFLGKFKMNKEELEKWFKENDPDFFELIEYMKDENGNIRLTKENIDILGELPFSSKNDKCDFKGLKYATGQSINYDFPKKSRSFK
jgi:hypothetical protein